MAYNKEIYTKPDNNWGRYDNTDNSEDRQLVLGTETGAQLEEEIYLKN